MWLKALNASNRSCDETLSESLRFLNSERSQLLKPGPRTIPRPALPLRSCPAGTGANAAVLNHCVSVLGPLFGSAIMSGRTEQGLDPRQPCPLGSTSCEDVTVNGTPLWKVMIPENSHPPATCPSTLCCDLKNGRSYT